MVCKGRWRFGATFCCLCACMFGSLGGNSVSSSQNAHVNSGFWEPRLMCETSPLARVPSTASLWMACEITPLFKHSPNLPSYPHVLRIALFWIAREPCFSLYAFQLSTWYERIQNVADLLLRSMVIFSPTRDGHESVQQHGGIHIGRSRTLVGHKRMP